MTLRDELKDLLTGEPITRQDIRLRTGYADREIRQGIRELRLTGMRIVTNSDGGYFIAESESDYQKFRRGMVSRVAKIMQVVRAMDGQTIEGQEEICIGATDANG